MSDIFLQCPYDRLTAGLYSSTSSVRNCMILHSPLALGSEAPIGCESSVPTANAELSSSLVDFYTPFGRDRTELLPNGLLCRGSTLCARLDRRLMTGWHRLSSREWTQISEV